MNYARIYDEFIANRRGRNPQPAERHHIVPRCIGGNNAAENLILLSSEDHFFAHLLLAKIFGGKLNACAWLMTSKLHPARGRVAREKYGWLRRRYIIENSNRQKARMKDPAWKAKVLAKRAMTMKGVKINFSTERRANLAERLRAWLKANPDHHARLGKKLRGRVISTEHREKIAKTLKGHAVSDEAREKMRRASLGKKASSATRAKLSAALKGREMLPTQLANLRKMNQKGRPGFRIKPETKAKLSAALSGRPLTPEHRAKIAAAHQRRAVAARMAA
jgi:NUMOD3 motif